MFAQQVLFVLGTKGFVLLSGVLTSVILARGLGARGLGVYTAVFAVVHIILSLADLGVRQAITYTMGQQLYRDEDVVSNVLVLLVASSVISVTAAAIVFATGPARGYGINVLVPAVASIPLLLFCTYTRGVSLAKGWIHRFNGADLIQQSVFVISLLFLVLVWKAGVIGATVSYFSGATAAALFSFGILKAVAPIRLRVTGAIIGHIGSLGIQYAANLFVLTLNYRLGVLLVERLMTVEDVGIFAVGVRFAELLWQLPAAVGVVLFSRSARAVSVREAVARTALVLRILIPAMAAGGLILYVLAPMLLSVLFGREFISAVAPTRYLIPGVVVAIIFKVIYQDLAGRGHPLAGTGIIFMIAATNILCGLLLIPKLGINGAAIAASVSYMAGAIAFLYMYSRREGIPTRDLILLKPSDIQFIRAKINRRGGELPGSAGMSISSTEGI